MKIDVESLPKFVKNATNAELEASEDTIMLIYQKLATITKAVQTQKFIKPKQPPKVVSIVSRMATSTFAVKRMIKEHEDKIHLDAYLNTIEEIVSELEIHVVSNAINFFNIKLLKHYQKTINTFLVETKIMNSINYCINRLHDEVSDDGGDGKVS